MDLVHMDTIGVISPQSHDGEKVILALTDDYSGLVIAKELPSKKDVEKELKRMLVGMEMQTGRVCKRIRSDNGTEFVNHDFDTWLEERETDHDKSAPGTPEQNGRAERVNQILGEQISTMLVDAGLKSVYWGKCFPAAVMSINLTHNRGNPRSRFEMFTKRTPSVKFMRRFGCLSLCED